MSDLKVHGCFQELWGKFAGKFFCLLAITALLFVFVVQGQATDIVDPVSVEIEEVVAKARAGEMDEAIDDLNFLMLRNSRNNHLHYALGTLLEEKGDMSGAMKEYRKAYELLKKKLHGKR